MRGLEFGRHIKRLDWDTTGTPVFEATRGCPMSSHLGFRGGGVGPKTDKAGFIVELPGITALPSASFPDGAAFGDNLHVECLDINRLLDMTCAFGAFGRQRIAGPPRSLYPDRALADSRAQTSVPQTLHSGIPRINFSRAGPKGACTTGSTPRIRSGCTSVLVDREAPFKKGERGGSGTQRALRVHLRPDHIRWGRGLWRIFV